MFCIESTAVCLLIALIKTIIISAVKNPSHLSYRYGETGIFSEISSCGSAQIATVTSKELVITGN